MEVKLVMILCGIFLPAHVAYPSRQPIIGVVIQKTDVPESCKGNLTILGFFILE